MSDSTFATVPTPAADLSPPRPVLPRASVSHAQELVASARSLRSGALSDSIADSLSVSRTVVPARSRRRLALEFLRYFAASGGALAVDVGLYQLSMRAGLAYPVAALFGFCAGAAVAYLASVLWVFEARTVHHAGMEFALFVAVGAAGLLLTEALLWLEIGRWGLPALAAKIGAAAIVFIFNFAVRKALLFSAPAQ